MLSLLSLLSLLFSSLTLAKLCPSSRSFILSVVVSCYISENSYFSSHSTLLTCSAKRRLGKMKESVSRNVTRELKPKQTSKQQNLRLAWSGSLGSQGGEAAQSLEGTPILFCFLRHKYLTLGTFLFAFFFSSFTRLILLILFILYLVYLSYIFRVNSFTFEAVEAKKIIIIIIIIILIQIQSSDSGARVEYRCVPPTSWPRSIRDKG